MTAEDYLDVLRHVAFRKSSYSDQQAQCVEIGRADTAIGIRDSKQTDSPVIAVPANIGEAFLAAVKDGRLPLP